MNVSSVSERLRLGGELRALRDDLADRLTSEWFEDHPDFERAHPPRARQRTQEDFGYLIDFLAGSVESDSPGAFGDMVRWTGRVLEARGVPNAVLVDSLRRLEAALEARLSLRQYEVVRPILARAQCEGVSEGEPLGGGDESSELALDRDVYVQAVLHGDRGAALSVAQEALKRGSSVADVYLKILQGAMYEVGRRWEANRITVADEHLATAITQWVLAQLYVELEIPEDDRGRAVVTGIEGEPHQLGANMVADMLEADGWNVRFLGADVPRDAVLASVAEHDAGVLGVSATMLLHVARVAELVREARSRFGSDLRIVVGGSAFRFNPGAATQLGADGYAPDLAEAVGVFRDMERTSE